MSGQSRWNPLGALARSWGHFVRRPRATQVRTVALIAAVIAGVTIWVATAPSGSSATTSTVGPANGGSVGAGPSPVSSASTSARGVTDHTINVVFPVVSLNSLAGQEGFAEDAEYGEQQKAIDLFVGQINKSGGINGRKINPIITTFDPTNEAVMRADCKTWTEGSPAAFAVLDGIGAWTGDNELCITQEGQTPFIGQWSTVTDWTNQGSPYLWWTGPDQAVILKAVVEWGIHSGLLGKSKTVGVISGDRASDQLALNSYLLPDLRAVGVTPVVETIASDPTETATTDSQAPLVIQQLRNAGVTSVIPLIPFNVFFPVLQAETDQQYYPKLLLSDYEDSIESALGLIPIPYKKALDGQEGLTTETLGGVDGPRPESQGGYNTGVRKCWTVWHKVYPQIPPGNMNDVIEEQGPVAGWCEVIALFATAAKDAGPDLNRRTFVTAMSKITDFPGTWANVLSYGPDKRYGPTESQVVKLRVNSPPSPLLCKPTAGQPPPATCWVTVEPYAPLPAG